MYVLQIIDLLRDEHQHGQTCLVRKLEYQYVDEAIEPYNYYLPAYKTQAALEEAKKTVHGITGIEITDMTAKVDSNTGNITEYHTAVKIAFRVEH